MSEPTAPAGAIHDIGYRHYDGPRLGTSYIRRALFLETFRGSFGLGRSARSKIMPFLLLSVMVLPAVVVGIVAGYFGFDELPLGYTEYVVTMQVAVTVFVGSQAPAVMSRDLRFRVAPLYFSRPLSRQQYVQAKYAGMAAALLLLIGLPLTLLLAGALLAEMPLGEQVPDYLRAMGGAVLYALVLGGIGLVVAAMTPRRGVGVAAVVGVLLVLSGLQGAVSAMAERVRQRHVQRLHRPAVAVHPGRRRRLGPARRRSLGGRRTARRDRCGRVHGRDGPAARGVLRRAGGPLPEGSVMSTGGPR